MESINNRLQYLYAAQIIGSRPLSIPTHMSYRESISLFRTAQHLPKDSSIVEIGSWIGASLSVMSAATKVTNNPLVCIDTWMNEGMADDPGNETENVKNPYLGEKLSTFAEFQKNTVHLIHRLTKIRMDSAKLSA